MSEEKQPTNYRESMKALAESSAEARKAARKVSEPEVAEVAEVADFDHAESEIKPTPEGLDENKDWWDTGLAADIELALQRANKALEQEKEDEIAARLGKEPINVEEQRNGKNNIKPANGINKAEVRKIDKEVKNDNRGGNRWAKWFVFGAIALAAGLGIKGSVIDPLTSSRDLTPQPISGPRTPGVDTTKYDVLRFRDLDDHGNLPSKYGQLEKNYAEYLGFDGEDAFTGTDEYRDAKGADFTEKMSQGVSVFDSLNKTSADALKLNDEYIIPKDRAELFGPQRPVLEVVGAPEPATQPAISEVAAVAPVAVPAPERPRTAAPRVEDVNMRLDASFVGDRRIQSEADLLGQLKNNPLVRQIFNEQGISPDSVIAQNICKDTYQDMVSCGPRWGITESQLRDAFPIGQKIDMFARHNGKLVVTSVTYEGDKTDYGAKRFATNEIVYLINVGDKVVMVREICVNPALAVKTIVRAKIAVEAPTQIPAEVPVPPAPPIAAATPRPAPPMPTPRTIVYPTPEQRPVIREYQQPVFIPPVVEIPREVVRPNQPGQEALIKLICADLNRNLNCDPGEPIRPGGGFRFRIHHLVPGSLQYGPQEVYTDVISQSNGLGLGELQQIIFNGNLVDPQFRNYWVEELSGPEFSNSGGIITPDRDRVKWGRVGLLGTQNPDLQAITPAFVNLEQLPLIPLIPNTPIIPNTPTPLNTLTVYPSNTPRTPEATVTLTTPTVMPTNTEVIPTATVPGRTPTSPPTLTTPTVIPTNTEVPLPTATVPGRTPESTNTPRPTVETSTPTPIPTNTHVPFPTATESKPNTPVVPPTNTPRPTVETPRPTAIPTNTHAPIPTATQARFPTSIPVGR